MSTRRKSVSVIVLISVLLLVVHPGLFSLEPTKTIIKVDVLEGTERTWERIKETFEASHPNFEVKYTKLSEQQLLENARTTPTEETVRMVKYDWLKNAQSVRDATKDLGSYRKTFLDERVSYVTPGGKLLGTRFFPAMEDGWCLAVPSSINFAIETQDLLILCSSAMPQPTEPNRDALRPANAGKLEALAKKQLQDLARKLERPVPQTNKDFEVLLEWLWTEMQGKFNLPYAVLKAAVRFVAANIWNPIKEAFTNDISEEATIDPTAVIGKGVDIDNYAHIGPGATIWPGSEIDPRAKIGANVQLKDQSDVDDGVEIGDGTVIEAGEPAEHGIDEGTKIGAFAIIKKNADIDDDCRIYSFVTIGSDVEFDPDVIVYSGVTIGNNAFLDNNATIGMGSKIGNGFALGVKSKIGIYAEIGDNVKIGDNVTIGDRVEIGSHVRIKNGATIKSGTQLPGGQEGAEKVYPD